MFRNPNTRFLIPVIVVFILGITIALPNFTGIFTTVAGAPINIPASINLGLDLQGGIQVLLEAEPVPGQTIDAATMEVARTIVERRVNGLGVAEPLVQLQGENRISVELPGISNTEQAINLIKETGLLEFIDAGSTFIAAGTPVETTFELGIDDTAELPPGVFRTVMTGDKLRSAVAGLDQFGRYLIDFTLTDEGSRQFEDYTTDAASRPVRPQYLAIVLDGVVISSPTVEEPIPGGRGSISGSFTAEEANNLALQLSYGALPVALTVAESRTVGPTLGADSIDRSITAGIVGLVTVALFMVLYYRLPGFVAVIALLMYASVTFALFKLIPGFTLTLPGIAGFVLSIGVAVDANILIFERMREELRAGKSVAIAVEEGFRRAWPSIRDSNFSSLITCVILMWFGGQFGASVVVGFALTLALGVLVSMFTAITASRTFLYVALFRLSEKNAPFWFGL